MRIFIAVDMEGISGICLPEQVDRSNPLHQEARRYMLWDTNACVEGCFEGGASHVAVWDAHSTGHNMPWDQADPRAELWQGSGDEARLQDIGEYDALILLGYHARAGTQKAILDHTISAKGWQNCWINGRLAGEFAIDAGIAGDAGVPTIMTSGDDKLCREAREWVPNIHAAQVKTARSMFGARFLGKDAAHKLIRETAARACRERKKIKPLVHKKPVRLRLELVERQRVPNLHAALPHLKQIDGRTYEVTGATVAEALARL